MSEVGIVVLVTGSRSIKNRAFVFATLDAFARDAAKDAKRIVRLWHGGATGVDTLAGEWAREKSIQVTLERPDLVKFPFHKYGSRAYALRDFKMVDAADEVVAIWDGKSPGTRLTFDYANRKQKPVHITLYK